MNSQIFKKRKIALKNKPIGILDSGVGGLTVASTLLKELPDEQFLYIGDVKGYPYGDKSQEDAREYILEATDYLVNQGVKLIVFACNTATAAALNDAKEKYDIPIIGVIEPTARHAARTTENNHILLLCTEGTARSKFYARAIEAINPEIKVTTVGCTSFASFIESGGYHDRETSLKVIDETLSKERDTDADTVILGCTHYPMLKSSLEKYFDTPKTFVDSAEETLKDIQEILARDGISADKKPSDLRLKVYLTKESQNFENILNEWITDVEYSLETI